MSSTKIDRRAAQAGARANRNDELIARAAERVDWAGAALVSAAEDLGGARSCEGNPLTGISEVVMDEAARVARLAEDIASQLRDPAKQRPVLVLPGGADTRVRASTIRG
jgi:tagatose-1,6-bisphosphate aldolase non-catalytic subunit AgaZ/GatZ